MCSYRYVTTDAKEKTELGGRQGLVVTEVSPFRWMIECRAASKCAIEDYCRKHCTGHQGLRRHWYDLTGALEG